MEYTIYPYKDGHHWFFDDESTGLFREELVFGTDTIIHTLARRIRGIGIRKGIKLRFSDVEFEGSVSLRWDRRDKEGNWYFCDKLNMEGWLCPSLFLYFNPAPKQLFFKVSPKNKTPA